FTRPWADLVREHALESDRLVNMKPFEVAKFGVIFKLSEGRRGTIDGMLAEAPGLLQIEEVGALYTLIFWVVHWAPSPNHSLRRGWCLPLSVAVPAAAQPGGRLSRSLAYGVSPAGTCGYRSPHRLPADCLSEP